MGDGPTRKQTVKGVATLLTIFGIVCFFTSIVFTSGEGLPVVENLPPQGGIVGPIEVAEAGTVLEIEVFQPMRVDNIWSHISGELLDAEQEHLFAFDEELWRETGYDEGFWRETKNTYDLKVTVPEKGTFFVGVEGEAGTARGAVPDMGQIVGPMRVTVRPTMGSAVPMFAAGFVSLLVGIVLLIGAANMSEMS